ncbi:MAG TPA: cytochrome c [Opitutaceae bacterium]|nr:cytochrome c [Opitutaceae bacterium]
MIMKYLFAFSAAGLAAGLCADPASVPLSKTKGAKLYAQSCASCHMADGAGIPGVQPGIAGSPVAAGDAATVIKLILQGPAAVLPPPRPHYDNEMPAFVNWSDADVAAVSTYIRQKFAHGASVVTPEEVAAVRAAK